MIAERITLPGGTVLRLMAASRYTLCSSFMRLQEFYESDIPGIRGNFFTVEAYQDAYANRFGSFTYHLDWSGFNIPGEVFLDWLNKFPEETRLLKEKTLIGDISSALGADWDKPFYIIASYSDAPRLPFILNHELAHAVYTLSGQEFRDIADAMTATPELAPFVGRLRTKLTELGYHPGVLADEVWAFMSTSPTWEFRERFGLYIKKDLLEPARALLQDTVHRCGAMLSPELSEDEVEARRLGLQSKLGHRAGVNL
jgi:hypothetical protein